MAAEDNAPDTPLTDDAPELEQQAPDKPLHE